MKTGNADGAALVRLLTGLLFAAVVLLLVWVPFLSLGLAVLVAALVGQGFRELCALARARGLSPESVGGVTSATLVAFSGYWGDARITAMVLAATVLALCVLQVWRGLRLANLSVSVFGVVYVGWFGAHFVLMHGMPQTGAGLVTLLIAVVALSDTGAYTFGSWIGKHKLAPVVSPNKTWEGAAGGFALALISGAAVYALREGLGWNAFPDWSLGRYVATAAVVSVVGQLGDLAESAMKRYAGIKDSGAVFPGHGGVLDRCDSYLFAAPVLYYLVFPFGPT